MLLFGPSCVLVGTAVLLVGRFGVGGSLLVSHSCFKVGHYW